MSIEKDVKKVGRSPITWFLLGILAGGTILAYPVAMAVSWIKLKVFRKTE